MRRRIQALFWQPPDWFEAGLAVYAVVIGFLILPAAHAYYTSAVWAPVAGWLPHWALGAYIMIAGALWGWAVLWRRLAGRVVACFAGICFWIFIALLITRQAPGAVGAGFWWGHAVVHVLVWSRLVVEWNLRGRVEGPEHGHPDP